MVLFESVPNVGNLSLEKVLFEFDKEPIVFVCLDEKSERYLCLCTDNIIGYSWMITSIENELLIKLIQDEFSIYDTFKNSGSNIIIAEKDGQEIDYRECDFSSISEEELPDRDEKLENHFLQAYVLELKKSESGCKLTKPIVFKFTFNDYDYRNNSVAIRMGSSWSISLVCSTPVLCRQESIDTRPKTSIFDIGMGLRYHNFNDFIEDEFDEPKRDIKELIVCG